MFDAYGEYHTAFGGLAGKNPNITYKKYSITYRDANTAKRYKLALNELSVNKFEKFNGLIGPILAYNSKIVNPLDIYLKLNKIKKYYLLNFL